MVPNRSREPRRIRGRSSFCQYLWLRVTFTRVIPLCRSSLESSVKIVRPTHLLAMIAEPTLTICLDALQICELTS
jgi:hypothetical protein